MWTMIYRIFPSHLIHCLKSRHLSRGYNLTHILQWICFHIRKPSFFRSLVSNPNLRKIPESMFFNLSYATPDALRKLSFLRLSAAFAAYSPSHNGAFVSNLQQHLMLGLCVAHCSRVTSILPSQHGTIPSDWCQALCPFAETCPHLLKSRIHSCTPMQSVANLTSISRS